MPRISYAVVGDTATDHDDVQAVHDNTPLVFAVVATTMVAPGRRTTRQAGEPTLAAKAGRSGT